MPVWVAVIAAFGLLHVLQWAVLPFVLAAIVAFITDPPIRWFQRRAGAPRWLAAGGLYLLLLAIVVALAHAAGLSAWRDIDRLAGGGLAPLRQGLVDLVGPSGRDVFGIHLTADGLLDGVKEKLHGLLRPNFLQRMAPAVFGAAVGLVLSALLSFYLMLSGPRLARGALELAPPAWRPGLRDVLPQVVQIIQRYFIGIVCVVVFTVVATWIGYGLVFHVKGAAVLALAVGCLETIPLIGPALAAGLVALAASQLKSMTGVIGMVIYALALRLIVDDVLAPIVLGRSVAVHPVVVMLAYVVGAALFGVTGLLLAVPTAACLGLVARTAYGQTRERGSSTG